MNSTCLNKYIRMIAREEGITHEQAQEELIRMAQEAASSASPAVIPDPGRTGLPASVVRQPPVRINTFMTKKQFVALARHLMTGNPTSRFLTVWNDDDGNPKFSKAKPYRKADVQASWTYDTIEGKAKVNTSMGVYCKNEQNESTFGAIDFDAHQPGQDDLAKERAFNAFSLCLHYRDRHLILSASGRGYHVFVISEEPRPVKDWASELKEVCDGCLAPILDGQCEIFPNEKTHDQEIGKAIRLPGTMNPSTGDVEMILADTIMPLLDKLELKELKGQKNSTLIRNSLGAGELIRDKEAKSSFISTRHTASLPASQPGSQSAGQSGQTSPARPASQRLFLAQSTSRLVSQALEKHVITRKGTRNSVLIKLTGYLFRFFGHELARAVVSEHYDRSKGKVNTGKTEHMLEFEAAWEGFRRKELKRMTPKERDYYESCQTEAQKELAILCRSFGYKGGDFPLGQHSLADRLSATQPGAKYVIDKFVKDKALTKTADAKTNSQPARYKWNLSEAEVEP